MKKTVLFVWAHSQRAISMIILFLIRVYQKTISPNHGLFNGGIYYQKCRFYPTCSQYTHQAIESYGVLKGVFLGIKRLVKCHPWHEGGYDPL